MDVRRQQLQQWVNQQLISQALSPIGQLEIVSGDASFRRYFRQSTNKHSLICVDAPPEHEDSHPFVIIATHWQKHGVNVPQIQAVDYKNGFMLLSDFGDQLFADRLSVDSADNLYSLALDNLIAIQQIQDQELPQYDQSLLDSEMLLFRDWYLTQHLKMSLTAADERLLTQTFDLLRDTALGQPQVVVHRDYHCRNLMYLEDADSPTLGIIDFQDAVIGPFTYDLISLLRDAYIDWPQEQVYKWADMYFDKAREEGIAGGQSPHQLRLWFDWMGLQRHLKVMGIFARLNYRDGKDSYMADIPRVFKYLTEVSAEYPSLEAFHQWLVERVLPQQQALEKAGSICAP